MNLVHVHLLLNHFPIIGTIIAVGIFLLGLVTKSDELKRTSLLVMLGLSILAIPTYMSGSGAQEIVCRSPEGAKVLPPCPDQNIHRAAIDIHNDTAMAAFAVMEVLGVFAWLGLWQYRRISKVTPANIAIILILSLLTLALMAAAGNTGGAIRHPESGEAMNSPLPWLTAAAVGHFVVSEPWMWPTCETLHFVGLSMLFGIVLVVDLRILGVVKFVSFKVLHRLMPWAIMGFAINTLTGMLFFIASHESNHYTVSGTFQWKMLLILIAALNAVYFTLFDEPWELGPGDDAPTFAKAMAGLAMVLWIGILFCGSMLPFLGNAF